MFFKNYLLDIYGEIDAKYFNSFKIQLNTKY